MTNNTHAYIDADVLYAWLTSLEETVKKDYEERGLDEGEGTRLSHRSQSRESYGKSSIARSAAGSLAFPVIQLQKSWMAWTH